jgi:hypothetical protein
MPPLNVGSAQPRARAQARTPAAVRAARQRPVKRAPVKRARSLEPIDALQAEEADSGSDIGDGVAPEVAAGVHPAGVTPSAHGGEPVLDDDDAAMAAFEADIAGLTPSGEVGEAPAATPSQPPAGDGDESPPKGARTVVNAEADPEQRADEGQHVA